MPGVGVWVGAGTCGFASHFGAYGEHFGAVRPNGFSNALKYQAPPNITIIATIKAITVPLPNLRFLGWAISVSFVPKRTLTDALEFTAQPLPSSSGAIERIRSFRLAIIIEGKDIAKITPIIPSGIK